MSRYIHERREWPEFRWSQEALAQRLAAVRHRQGRLIGRMEALGLSERSDAVVKTLTLDIVQSSGIEGETLDSEQVRSSIARRLGLDIAGLVPSDRRVDGVVEMTLEATQNYVQPLSAERIRGWRRTLFPKGMAGRPGIRIGAWRDDSKGPMQVVSGALGRERVHYEAPPAARVDAEMATFMGWANRTGDIDPVLRAAVAHLWFVTIHPFDDGNGRIARAIADWALARSENSPHRFYSMSTQIRRERKEYYERLEAAQKGTLDVTAWMEWFLDCLDRAITGAEGSLAAVFRKDRFWKTHAAVPLNERQRRILNKLLDDDFKGKLTTSRWAKVTRCSQDTAWRDILELVERGILVKDGAGGRSTSYSLKAP